MLSTQYLLDQIERAGVEKHWSIYEGEQCEDKRLKVRCGLEHGGLLT